MTVITIEMPDLFSTQEAADLIGISNMTVFRWIKAGRLTPVSVDHRTLITRTEILREVIKKCSTCYYNQEFGHCSCRMAEDVDARPGKCSNWLLPENLQKRS